MNKMKITPRLMIVESLSTNFLDETQNLSLALLTRDVSATLHKRPSISLSERLKMSKMSIQTMGKRSTCMPHIKDHKYKGMDYHLGDVLTEEEVLDKLDYAHPFIDSDILPALKVCPSGKSSLRSEQGVLLI